VALFGRRNVVYILTSPAQLQPVHRGRHVEDPLLDLLAQWPGSDIVGGGTQLDEEHRISGFAIEIEVPPRHAREALKAMTDLLDPRLPVGSRIGTRSGDELPIGRLEGLVLRFAEITEVDFTDPDEVEHNTEIDRIVARLMQILSPDPILASWRVMAADSEIALYGGSRQRMRQLIDEHLGKELTSYGGSVRDAR
jgi:hypothetical protein